MPKHLLGRQQELVSLHDAITDISSGKDQLVSITGVAGTGKTALVDEFIAECKSRYPKHIFANGKFGQLENSKPYSALIQILEQLANFVLLQDDQTYTEFKGAITKALGDNLGVLTSISPSFTAIMGQQPTPIVLASTETKNRFYHVVEDLLSVYANYGKPLILFFDDLQWADGLSISLLERVLECEWSSEVLFLISYRSDEINDNKPLLDMLSGLVKKSKTAEISLKNLSYQDVDEFVAVTLNDIPSKVAEITKHVMDITQGNAFGVSHYLKMLYQDGSIKYIDETKRWQCDLDSDYGLTKESGVHELLHEIIRRLTKQQKLILYYGMFLQDYFSMENLLMVMESDADEILSDIEIINRQGLIVINENGYQFQHDRILRAVIESLDEHEHNEFKLGLARNLVEKLSAEEISERCIEIVEYFNSSIEKLKEEELLSVLKLNIEATQDTMKDGVYELSLRYSEHSLAVLERLGDLGSEYRYSIYLNLARSYYLNAAYERAKHIIAEAFKLATSKESECRCFGIYKDIVISEGGDYASVVDLGCEVLKGFDIVVPVNNKELSEEISRLRKHANNMLAAKTIPEHVDSLASTSNENKHLLILLNDLWEAAYYAGKEQLMQYTNLLNVDVSLRNGNTSESALGYVMVGMLETLEGNYDKAYGLGELALALNDKFNDQVMLPKVTNLFCNYISFYKKPFIDSATLYKRSTEVGKGNGDHLFGLWAAMFEVWSLWLSGQSLDVVMEVATKRKPFITQTGDTKIIYVFSLLEDIAHYLSDNESDEKLGEYGEIIEFWQQNDFLPGISWLHILLGQLYCIIGDFDKAYSLLAKKGLTVSPGIIMFPYAQYIFYSALSSLRVRHEGGIEESDTAIDVEAHINLLKAWMRSAPENFEYQYYLLKAEMSALNEEYWQAQQFFNEAITSAEKFGNNFPIAFCNEMKADFLERVNDHVISSFHRNISTNYYLAWGAKFKASEITFNPEKNLTTQENVINVADISYDPGYQGTHSRDFDSILKLTRALSRQLDEKSLLAKALEILVDNTKPERAALLINHSGITALRVLSDRKSDFLIQQLDVSPEKSAKIPASYIRYAVRSKNALVLDRDEFIESNNGSSYVFEPGVQSIICLPVMQHSNLQVVLYMENRLPASYFNSNRIRVLSIILSQVVMSLNNIKLYKSLQGESIKLKHTAEKLELSENRLSLATMYSEVGVWEWDIESNDLFWSEMIGPILGGPTSEVQTSFENFINLVHPEDRKKVEDAINDCFEGKEYRVEHRVVWEDGTIRWVQEAGDVIRNEAGKPLRMLGTARDVTEIKDNTEARIALEMQLQQAQKMEALGQLTGGIAHDFNNLLGINMGYTELLQQTVKNLNDAKLNGFIEQIMSSAKRASELVSQMLAFSRTNEAESITLDLQPVVKDTIKMLSSMISSSIRIKVDLSSNLPMVIANPVQLNQVIINICINARDAIGEKGEISIGLHHHNEINERCTSCHASVSGEYVELSIKDTAGGIPANILEKIFNPFFTTKEVGQGTGMGLAMVHGILHGHGAHIIVESDIDKGSNFRLLFRVSSDQARIEHEEEIEIAHASDKKRVLVVDDEQGIVDFLTDLLTENGYTVSGYSDSHLALSEIESNLQQYDLLITDQTMPDVTGAELAKTAVSIDKTFPVYILTGYSEYLDVEKASEIGVRKLMQKPVKIGELLSELSKLS